jgi:hypothetical protein
MDVVLLATVAVATDPEINPSGGSPTSPADQADANTSRLPTSHAEVLCFNGPHVDHDWHQSLRYPQ